MGQILNYDAAINARASGHYFDAWVLHSHGRDNAGTWSWQYTTAVPNVADSWVPDSEFCFGNGVTFNRSYPGVETLANGGLLFSANSDFGAPKPSIPPPTGGRQRWITAAETTLLSHRATYVNDLLWLCKHQMNGASATGTSPTLRRFADGEGVQIIVYVSMIALTTVPETQVTITYTNQDGVAGRTAVGWFKTIASNGTCAASTFYSGDNKKVAVSPFLALQAGDSGVRAVTGIALSSTGNTAFLVVALVKPLFTIGPRLGASVRSEDLLARPEGPIELVIGSDGQHGALHFISGIRPFDSYTHCGMTRVATVEV